MMLRAGYCAVLRIYMRETDQMAYMNKHKVENTQFSNEAEIVCESNWNDLRK